MYSYFLPYISLPLSEFISTLWGSLILPWECYFYYHLWNSLQVTWLPPDDIWTLNSTTWPLLLWDSLIPIAINEANLSNRMPCHWQRFPEENLCRVLSNAASFSIAYYWWPWWGVCLPGPSGFICFGYARISMNILNLLFLLLPQFRHFYCKSQFPRSQTKNEFAQPSGVLVTMVHWTSQIKSSPY